MTHGMYAGAMSILFMVLVAPLFGQSGVYVSLFEFPEPFVFSKQRHFVKGVSRTLSLLVSNDPGNINGDNDDDSEESSFDDIFNRWDILVNAEGNLNSGSHFIPVSSISVKVKGSPEFRSLGKMFLSTNYQTIARSKPGFNRVNQSIVKIKLKAHNGADFLKPSGEYSTYIYFTLMMD